MSANVPMLIGTNLNEFIHGVDQPDVDSLTNEELLKQFNSRYGAKAQAIVDSLRREYPWAKPFDIFSIAGQSPTRNLGYTGAAQGCPGRRACVRLPVRMADSNA